MEIIGYEISGTPGAAIIALDGSVWDIIGGAIVALESGPNLGLLVHGNQGEAHYSEFCRLLRGIDGLIMPAVADKDLSSPPGSPADGDRYLVAGTGTGAWSGHDGDVARYSAKAAAWEFYTPTAGWLVFVRDESKLYYHTGSAWAELVTGGSTGASVLEVQVYS